MIDKVKRSLETFGQAWTACLLAMVQGNLLVLTFYHAQVAAKTGAITALAYFVCSFFSRLDNKWANAMLVGLLTSFADILVHPTHFGAAWTESVVTGLGAGVLAILLHNLKR